MLLTYSTTKGCTLWESVSGHSGRSNREREREIEGSTGIRAPWDIKHPTTPSSINLSERFLFQETTLELLRLHLVLISVSRTLPPGVGCECRHKHTPAYNLPMHNTTDAATFLLYLPTSHCLCLSGLFFFFYTLFIPHFTPAHVMNYWYLITQCSHLCMSLNLRRFLNHTCNLSFSKHYKS